jgi:hypothetical protein
MHSVAPLSDLPPRTPVHPPPFCVCSDYSVCAALCPRLITPHSRPVHSPPAHSCLEDRLGSAQQVVAPCHAWRVGTHSAIASCRRPVAVRAFTRPGQFFFLVLVVPCPFPCTHHDRQSGTGVPSSPSFGSTAGKILSRVWYWYPTHPHYAEIYPND